MCFFSFCVSKQDGVVSDKDSVLYYSKRDFIRTATAAAAERKMRPVQYYECCIGSLLYLRLKYETLYYIFLMVHATGWC